ncbi:Card1-like endonuclease domain-containing protein [Thiomicrospira microaerophila]|uniref:Card1-like endonuclease domain-containing protein n=1 Tax=Thiomicrospira microaerophila TaxID=406020 RepID=UPI0005CA1829|nr:DUF1887 family CARF protein [Thiomicrospira microaerophila]
MATKHIHLCLVSKQPTPNLVPLIDPNLQVDEAILLHTDSFKQHALWLQQALAMYQIKTRLDVLPSADNMHQLHDFLIQLYEKLKQETPDSKIYCNITSGTKTMSIALYELALMTADEGTQAYYQNLDDTLSWYVPLTTERHEIIDRVKIKPFLLSHGVDTLNQSHSRVAPQWRPLIDELVMNLSQYQSAISTLNFHAVSASYNPNLVSENEIKSRFPSLNALLKLLQDHGLIQWQGPYIKFPSEQARFFCAGGWLEEHVYHTIRKMMAKNKRIQDLAQGLEVYSLLQGKANTIKNELDVAVLVNNRLVVIECKTYQTDKENSPVPDSLYKLDTLASQTGGAFGRGIFICLNPLKPNDYERAKRYNIEVIQGDRFAQLQTALERFIY